MPRYLAPLILLLSLKGCATAPRDACQTTVWYDAGYHDGLRGHVSRSVAAQSEVCASDGESSPLASYEQGRSAGLKHFCTHRNGFSLGLEGGDYNGVCPVDAEQDFVSAYEQGKAIFAAEMQVRRLEEILQVNTSELHNLTVSVQEKETELLSPGTTRTRRGVLLLEVSDLRATLAMVENEISGIQTALAEQNGRLKKLRENSP